MLKPIFIFLAVAFYASRLLQAGPLTEAHVTRIVNDVRVIDPAKGAHAASINESIKDEIGLKTGIKSRSELVFQDNTLTRIGPETSFSFKAGTREMSLEQGTLLLQVPKGLGGAKIRTAAVTAAITGTTIMMEYTPAKNLKVLVLEGSLRLSVNGTFGDSVLLQAGRMVIMRPDAKHIPDPVAVDLRRVMKTSSLVKMAKNGEAELPSAGLIEKEIKQQDGERGKGGLIETNLVIDGHGTNVKIEPVPVLVSLDRRAVNSVDPLPAGAPAPEPVATPGSTPSLVDPSPTPGPSVSPSPTPSGSPSPTAAPTATPSPTASEDDDTTPPTASHLEIHREDSTPLNINYPLNIFGAHSGGTVSIEAKETITLSSKTKVSQATGPFRSNNGGTVSVRGKKKTGTAIAVTSSAQLLSLLDVAARGPGGKIEFRSDGGLIDINGAKMTADRGTIDIQNRGDRGDINLQNATLSASTVKLGALGKNGALNIGGGTISADTAIRLYAAGANGTVNFTDNVTLNGLSVKTIAGNTVTVMNGKVVTINGPSPAGVFTNHPNYSGWGGNGSTTGTFAGQGVTTFQLRDAPKY